MAWNDDSWKGGYDAWKLASPYDDDDEYYPRDDCEHEDYDIDVCTGRASCNCCDHHWYLSSEQINRELDRQAAYYDDMERENRRQWWRDLWASIRSFFRPKPKAPVNDDEIPF